jgi:hypothetical protein
VCVRGGGRVCGPWSDPGYGGAVSGASELSDGLAAETHGVGGPPGLRGRPSWWWLVVLAGAPFVVALAWSFQGSWHVTGDAAIFATRVLEAPGDPPLVGVYSRFGWYHPGPALAWWFLVPSWLSGGAPAVLSAAGMALKGLAAVWATILAGRLAGFVGAALAVATATILLLSHPDTAYSIWNPTVVVLCFFCAVVAAWATAAGDRWGPTVLVVAGSICAQAHVGYLPLVVVLVGLAGVTAAIGERRASGAGPGWRAPLLVAAVAGLVVWAPALVDQFLATGNLGELLAYFTGDQGGSLGLSSALGIVARSVAPWGPWIGGAEPTGLLSDLRPAPLWWLTFPIIALALAAASAWRRRDRVLAVLVVVVAGASMAGVVTLASLSDVAYPYLFAWSGVLGAMIWFTAVLAFVRTVLDVRPALTLAVRRFAAVGAAAVVLGGLVVVPSGPRPVAVDSEAVGAFLPAAFEATSPGETVAMTFTEAFPGVAEGLVYELERGGRRVTVGPESDFTWSGTRGGDPDAADVRLAVATAESVDRFAGDPAWEELARFDPLDPAERQEYERLATALRERLEVTAPAGVSAFVAAAPRAFVDDPDLADLDLRRFIELTPRRDAYVLYRAR